MRASRAERKLKKRRKETLNLVNGSSAIRLSSLTHSQESPEMAPHQGVLLCLGFLLLTAGVVMSMCIGLPLHSELLFGFGLFLSLVGVAFLVVGFCVVKKNLQMAVTGHSLLHPRTGSRFTPQQALALQRRLDRIRREMSEESVSRRAEPETPLPSTPPPWTMEPPPSYDTVMKSQEWSDQLLPEPPVPPVPP